MHDARVLIDMGEDAVRRLARRGYTLDLSSLESLQSRRNKSIQSGDELRSESKRIAQEVQQTAKAGGDISALKETARKLKEQIRESEVEQERIQQDLTELLLTIPNLPADEAPDGDSEEFAVEQRRAGTPPAFSFEPKDHVDLGEAMASWTSAGRPSCPGHASASCVVSARPWSARWRRCSWTCTPAATVTSSTPCRSWSAVRR